MKIPPTRWWDSSYHADRRAGLLARNRIKSAIAAWFAGEDFVAVEASTLQTSPGIETHLHAFGTTIRNPGGAEAPLYLHTSPEFAMKKLLAAGETRLYDFARVFRNRSRDALHAPEFTLLEWYRAGEPLARLMADSSEILRRAASATNTKEFRFRDRVSDPFAEPEYLTVAEAFRRFAEVDLLSTLRDDGGGNRNSLAAAIGKTGLRTAADDSWSDIFSRALSEFIEPRLGIGHPTFLVDYPLPEAALAKPKLDDPRLAERFELYMCGVELANAFEELTDPREQRRRFAADLDEKARLFGEVYPVDEDFLAALAQMPAASGAALGFDRLVMLALGAPRIDLVQWTPVADPFAGGADG